MEIKNEKWKFSNFIEVSLACQSVGSELGLRRAGHTREVAEDNSGSGIVFNDSGVCVNTLTILASDSSNLSVYLVDKNS